MIRFLRKIRRKILNKDTSDRLAGKFRTYSIYAIGEIVLVVIGIIFALAINNWNSDREDHLNQKAYFFFKLNLLNTIGYPEYYDRKSN